MVVHGYIVYITLGGVIPENGYLRGGGGGGCVENIFIYICLYVCMYIPRLEDDNGDEQTRYLIGSGVWLQIKL